MTEARQASLLAWVYYFHPDSGNYEEGQFDRDINDHFTPLGGPQVEIAAIEAIERAKLAGATPHELEAAGFNALPEPDHPKAPIAIAFALQAHSASHVLRGIINTRLGIIESLSDTTRSVSHG